MKIQISARTLNEEEKKEFGVFVSHSNDSDLFKTVCSAFEEAGVPHLVDKQIAIASLNFADEIKQLIDKCKCAVVAVTEGALKSSWVNFEVGMLFGEGKKVFLYDPQHLLEKCKSYHMDKFPVFDEMEGIIAAVKETGYFSGLFHHNTEALSKQLFEKRAELFTQPVKLIINVPGLENLGLEDFYFSALVSTFGAYCGKYGEDNLCFQNFEESEVCPVSHCGCALNNSPDVADFPECVILNKVMEKAIVKKDEITFVLPLHKVYGTCFKLFAEVADSKQTDRLFALLDEYGLNPSVSKSGDRNRIYFCLPDSNWEGVFKLKDEFSNNFLCPGIAESDGE